MFLINNYATDRHVQIYTDTNAEPNCLLNDYMIAFPGRDFPLRDVDRPFNRLVKFRNRLREAVGLCVPSVPSVSLARVYWRNNDTKLVLLDYPDTYCAHNGLLSIFVFRQNVWQSVNTGVIIYRLTVTVSNASDKNAYVAGVPIPWRCSHQHE